MPMPRVRDSAGWYCLACNTRVDKEMTSCPGCGTGFSDAPDIDAPPGRAGGQHGTRSPAHATPVFCSQCGVPLSKDARFCSSCGTQLVQPARTPAATWGPKCQYCQDPMSLDAIRCPKCGKYLHAIEQDRNKARVFELSAVGFGVFAYIVMMSLRNEAMSRPWMQEAVRSRLWVVWVLYGIALVLAFAALPAWYRVGKRTGEWFWF